MLDDLLQPFKGISYIGISHLGSICVEKKKRKEFGIELMTKLMTFVKFINKHA